MNNYRWMSIVFAVTMVIYLPLLNAQFLNWDDQYHIVNNQATYALDWAHLKIAFTQVIQKVYMPLTTLVWTIERAIFGLNPTVFHVTNMIIHALNACLVGVLAMRLGLMPLGALVAALIFSTHPMRVESVAWITETKDVLCALFYVLTLIQWIDYRRSPSRGAYMLALFYALLALLAKPMAISLPITLLVMDIFLQIRLQRADFINKLPFAVLSGLIGLITYQHHIRFPLSNLLENISIFCYTVMFYPIKFILPLQLTPIYTLPEPIVWMNPIYLVSILGVGGLAGLIFIVRRNRWILCSILFWIGSMFFLFRYDGGHDINIVADRFIYIPSIFACIAIGYWFEHFKKIGRTLIIILIIVYAWLSFNQARYWQDSVTLFSYAIRLNSRNTVALNNRGGAYHEKKKYDLAINDYTRILEIKPGDSDTLMNRGLSYQSKADHTLAISDFNEVLLVYPTYARGYLQRGVSFLKLGLYEQALNDFARTITINPDYAEAYYNRGLVFLKLGQTENALHEFNQAVKLKPTLISAYNNRGVLLARLKAFDLAKKDFKRVLNQDPKNEEALYNLKVIKILEETKSLTPQQVR